MEMGFAHYEGVGGLEPDTLLPSQYFDRVRSRTEHDPERRLMLAVLEQGVHDYVKNAGAKERHKVELFLDAEQWVEGTDSGWLLSFENICHVLDLDPDYLRRGLRRWKRRTGGFPAAEPALASAEVDLDDEAEAVGA
jgi:hypothetical protein